MTSAAIRAGSAVMGHSAGAYIAAMLALDPRWLGNDRARLHSVIGLAGPYDFLPLTDPVLQVIFGTEPDLTRTRPSPSPTAPLRHSC